MVTDGVFGRDTGRSVAVQRRQARWFASGPNAPTMWCFGDILGNYGMSHMLVALGEMSVLYFCNVTNLCP